MARHSRVVDPRGDACRQIEAAVQVAELERAAREVSATLDDVETRLGTSRFLCGDKVTEADVRLFPTIVRFDVVYATLFKCSSRRVA